MHNDRTRKQFKHVSKYLCLTALLSITASGCGNSAQTEIPSQSPLPATPTQITQMTRTLSGPELDGTKIAGQATVDAPQHAMETQVAEGTPGPVPTFFPISPPETPVWTPTLGISGECAQGNRQFNYGGCWAGIVDNQYLFLETGAFFDDPSHGAVRVYTSTLDLYAPGAKQIYFTPSAAGRLHPVQVDWPVITMVTLDVDHPAYFAFNIATRQWVSVTPSPVPSTTVSPILSVTP